MDIATYFRAQAYNNGWANFRLFNACALLSVEEFAQARNSFFPSIVETLNHILTVDWFYISALEGASVGLSAFEPEIPFRDIGELQNQQSLADWRLINICEQAGDEYFKRQVSMIRSATVQREEAGRVLLHLFQHQIHHRGQVHAMLSETDIMPPQLDEFFPASETELRREEFIALGYSENTIWG